MNIVIKYKSGEEVIPEENLFLLNEEQKRELLKKFKKISKDEHEEIYNKKEHDKKIKMRLSDEQQQNIIALKNELLDIIKKEFNVNHGNSQTEYDFINYLKREKIIVFTPHAAEMLGERLGDRKNLNITEIDNESPFDKLREIKLPLSDIQDLKDEVILVFIDSDFVEDRVEWAPINEYNKSIPRVTFRKDMDQTAVCAETYTEFSEDGTLFRIITVIKKSSL